MKHKNRKKGGSWKVKNLGVATLLACIFSLSTVKAQEAISTTGGNASGSGGSVSYSVGQVVYTTNIGTNGSVVQGVQQPYEISIVTGLEEANGINFSVSAYPNPATDYLTLEVKDYELSTLNFRLFDIHGNILQTQKITSKRTNIVVSNLVPATYYIKVMDGNKQVKTFKIVKTQ